MRKCCDSSREGINVGGYFRTESGVGSAVRGYLRALRHLDVPLALNDLSAFTGNRAGDESVKSFDTEFPYDVNLICSDVETHFAILAHAGNGYFRERYNIAVWAWELPRFPERWYDRFAYYDEVWVASSFIANSLAPVSPIPVFRVPPVLSLEKPGARDKGRQRLGISDAEFVFLFIFDFHSRAARKNPAAVIEAFKRAFGPEEEARLIVKCVNARSDPRGFAELRERGERRTVSIIDGYWTGAQMRDLMAACDAYVSLHRAEGTGLTITEAMAAGKPVIATGWSGNMDFMNVSNSFPVEYELVEIENEAGQYRAGETWAEPSAEHAAELMRRVFDSPEEVARRARTAGREINDHYSEAPIAELIRRRLEIARNRHQFAALRRELSPAPTNLDDFQERFRDIEEYVPVKHLRYRQLIGHVRAAVRESLRPGATVAVVSRGDEDLLNFEGHKGWHFPRAEGGAYAGHYPADSREAVEHLEALRARGGDHLLVPHTSFWWLEHYEGLRRHLDANYRRVWDDQHCVIFNLSSPSDRRNDD